MISQKIKLDKNQLGMYNLIHICFLEIYTQLKESIIQWYDVTLLIMHPKFNLFKSPWNKEKKDQPYAK
jgi:hypothetical protein